MPKSLSQIIRRLARDEIRRARDAKLRPTASAARPFFTSRTSPASAATFPDPEIFTGGRVRATSPPSLQVIQDPLSGRSEGQEVSIGAPITLTVPTVVMPRTLYVVVNGNGVAQVVPFPSPGILVTALVYLPFDDTYEIRDTEPDSAFDRAGWIQQFSDAHLGNVLIDGDDPALRNAIQQIAAEGIIGDLVLSEGLKITNPVGTVEIDSQKITIFDGSGKPRAKFDEDSVDFFDEDGILLATFGATEGRVGNISIQQNAIQSRDFSAGSKGFQIRDTGYAEFEEGLYRGTLVVPALRTATYASGTQTFSFQRRRHLIEDITVSDGQIVAFSNLTDHKGFPIPDFQNKPVVILRENDVPIFSGDVFSGNRIVTRRFFADPVQSGNSLGYWNAARVTAQFRVLGEDVGVASSMTEYSGSQIGPFTGLTRGGTDDANVEAAYDGYHTPTFSGTGLASGSSVEVFILSKVQGGAAGDWATYRFDYTIRVGQSGNMVVSPVETSQSISVMVSHDSTGSGDFTTQVSSLAFDLGTVDLDRVVKVDWNGATVLDADPAPGKGFSMTPHAFLGKVIYSVEGVASGSALSNLLVDMEVTED